MQDAIGGLVNLVIIVVFLVIVSGYLAFNVNYTKAFKVKNKIISTFESYEGNCGSTTACEKKIIEYMNQIGYAHDDRHTPSNLEKDDYSCSGGYCYKKVIVTDESGKDVIGEGYQKVYYKVATQITIDIPIINNIMSNLRVFQVSGDTKVIKERTN